MFSKLPNSSAPRDRIVSTVVAFRGLSQQRRVNHLATDLDARRGITNVGIANRGARNLVRLAQANLQLITAGGEPTVQVRQIRAAAADAHVVQRRVAAHRAGQHQAQAGITRIRRVRVLALHVRRLLQHVGLHQRLGKNQLRLIGLRKRIVRTCDDGSVGTNQFDHACPTHARCGRCRSTLPSRHSPESCTRRDRSANSDYREPRSPAASSRRCPFRVEPTRPNVCDVSGVAFVPGPAIPLGSLSRMISTLRS